MCVSQPINDETMRVLRRKGLIVRVRELLERRYKMGAESLVVCPLNNWTCNSIRPPRLVLRCALFKAPLTLRHPVSKRKRGF